MLSVVVPIYNVEKYLSRCIDSIIDQTYRDLEIILVNDGSTDRSESICEKYAETDKRIKVVHKENGGLVSARKAGIRIAKGQYIAFVDGDDWIEADMYQSLMDIIEEKGVDLVDSGYIKENCGINSKQTLCTAFYNLDSNMKHKLYRALLRLDHSIKINPSIWSKIFRTELIKKCYLNVPDDRSYGEDLVNLIYCIAEASSIGQVEEAYYHYIYRNDSIVHSLNLRSLENVFELWKLCKEIILKYDQQISINEMDLVLFRQLQGVLTTWDNKEIGLLQRFIFPRMDLLFGKNIVIYGAGKVGEDYVKQISKNEKCNIVGWADKKHDVYKFAYRKVYSIEDVLNKEFDIILIAINNKKIVNEIKSELLNLKIPEKKIMWYAPHQQF